MKQTSEARGSDGGDSDNHSHNSNERVIGGKRQPAGPAFVSGAQRNTLSRECEEDFPLPDGGLVLWKAKKDSTARVT